MSYEAWLKPFIFQKLGEHREVPSGRNHPYYYYDAVDWQKAARAMHARLVETRENLALALKACHDSGMALGHPDLERVLAFTDRVAKEEGNDGQH